MTPSVSDAANAGSGAAPTAVGDAKRAVRAAARAARREVTGRAEKSERIAELVTGLAVVRAARVAHVYLATAREVDTAPILRRLFATGVRVEVPLLDADAAPMRHGWLLAADLDDLTTGARGVPSPRIVRLADPAEADVFIVPLVAFDRSCRRLGQGGGDYDLVLAGSSAPAVGVAFSVQEVAVVPTEDHDVRLTCVITEREVRHPE